MNECHTSGKERGLSRAKYSFEIMDEFGAPRKPRIAATLITLVVAEYGSKN
jgi:hypothetical protein